MNLWNISLRNLSVRKLSTILTATSVAIGAALVTVLWSLRDQADERYARAVTGYRAIVGSSEGSRLELVLDTVFNFGDSQRVVPFRVFRDLESPKGRLRRSIGPMHVFPQVRGDSVGGFPIIGTTSKWFESFSILPARTEKRGDEEVRIYDPLEFAEGGAWTFSNEQLIQFAEELAELFEQEFELAVNDPRRKQFGDLVPENWRQAVIGSEVAKRLGLGVGGTITPVHGMEDSEFADVHTEAECRISGVLAETGSPIDRAVYIPAAAFLALSGHKPFPDSAASPKADDMMLSSIVVRPLGHFGPRNLQRAFQSRADAQVAWPADEITKLLALIGDAKLVLDIVAWLVVISSSLGVLVALYNTMNERRREIAIMRSLGARRFQIFAIVVVEASLLSLLGAVLGVLLGHVGLYLTGPWIEKLSGIPVDGTTFSIDELALILGLGVLGAFAGLLPALKASRTEVAEHLNPTT